MRVWLWVWFSHGILPHVDSFVFFALESISVQKSTLKWCFWCSMPHTYICVAADFHMIRKPTVDRWQTGYRLALYCTRCFLNVDVLVMCLSWYIAKWHYLHKHWYACISADAHENSICYNWHALKKCSYRPELRCHSTPLNRICSETFLVFKYYAWYICYHFWEIGLKKPSTI